MTDHPVTPPVPTTPPPYPPTMTTVTAAITIDGTRYSHVECTDTKAWNAGGEHLQNMIRAQARDRLARGLAEQLPITLTEAEECLPRCRAESDDV